MIKNRVSCLVGICGALLVSATAMAETKVNILHFTDYHSHAVGFYSEGLHDQGGLAKAVGYIKTFRQTKPNSMVFCGGDMVNVGTPSWSDKYRFKDIELFNGLADAMAFGNHEADYGWDAFAAAVNNLSYPVLCANLVTEADGQPIFKPYTIKEVDGARVGVFSVAGPDFASLVKKQNLPSGAVFTDHIKAAERVVKTLREVEKVDAVVVIGHQETDADMAMAKRVPGIDLIFGTHSHSKDEFQKIPGTETYYISAYQYLTYMAEVELTLDNGRLISAKGNLVKMDASVAPDGDVAFQVAAMQKALEEDPAFAAKFVRLGDAGVEFSLTGVDKGESLLGNFVLDTVRRKVGAHMAVSTASSFRAAISPGVVKVEDYLTAVPYKNQVLVYELYGKDIVNLIDLSISKSGTGLFTALSGVRVGVNGGNAVSFGILKDRLDEKAGFVALCPDKTYYVAASDYQSKIAAGYKEIFAKAISVRDAQTTVNDIVMEAIRTSSPVSATLDGRIIVH